MIKRYGVLWLCLVFSLSLNAQTQVGKYVFTEDIDLPFTPYKMQGNTGTCWSFATHSFWESELLRIGKGNFDLAEMFVVRHAYEEKAANYILRQGSARLTQGGLAADVLQLIDRYGVVPQQVYDQQGTPDGKWDHSAMYEELKAYADSVIETQVQGNRVDWRAGVQEILDRYFGPVPPSFTYAGESYTPQIFAAKLGLNPSDYVTLTSFTHHPFYAPFVLEVPDNWANGAQYNLPLDAFVQVIDYALDQGFTLDWDINTADIGFSNTLGLAIVPQEDLSGIAIEANDAFMGSKVFQEKEISPAYRQEMFESYQVKDDHLVHITGRVKDQQGRIFYKIKNSSGDGIRPTKGYLYASLPYVRLHSISILLHKDAIPPGIRAKLHL